MWEAETTGEFDHWFGGLDEDVQVKVTADVQVLRQVGPTLGRPLVDTLNGSKHANMKELRVRSGKLLIRIAFAFDPRKTAMLMIAGDKAGKNQKRFYKQLIKRADELFDAHLERLKTQKPRQ